MKQVDTGASKLISDEYEQFFARADVQGPWDCWNWKLKIASDGHAYTYFRGRGMGAHRAAYLLSGRQVQNGAIVHHLCKNGSCVNPVHLIALANHAEHAKEHLGERRKKFCPKGHLYDGDNLYLRPSGDQECKTCKRESLKRWRERKRSVVQTGEYP